MDVSKNEMHKGPRLRPKEICILFVSIGSIRFDVCTVEGQLVLLTKKKAEVVFKKIKRYCESS